MLAARLNTIHNLWYFSDLMQRIRSSLERGTFLALRDEFYRARAAGMPIGEARDGAHDDRRTGLD